MRLHLLLLFSLVLSFALPVNAGGVDLGKLSSDTAAKVVESEWQSLDKATGVESDFMGEKSHPDWGEALSLPFPTTWPPQSDMGFAYYVFGSYYTPMRHGPTVYQSAPWAKVVLRRDGAQQKTLLCTSIGPAIEARGSRPLTGEQGAQYSSIQALGNASMQFLLTWSALPEEGNWPAADVRRLYCQWSLDNPTLYEGYIKSSHLDFDRWLSCDRFEQQNGIVFDLRDNHREQANTADASDHEKLASQRSPDDSHGFNHLSGVKAGLRGTVFGIGEGIAAAIGVALQASRIESVKNEPSGRLAERRVYSKDGLTVAVTVLPGDGAILPNMVEAATPAAIRMVSKSLSEMNRAALIANLGPPDVEGASIVRYRGPMELCEESVDFRFEEQALVSVLWQFCGGR